MKQVILSIIFIFYSLYSVAQLFETKSNFLIGYNAGGFVGKQLFNSQGTIAPSYYSAIDTFKGLTLGVAYKLSTHFSTGILVDYSYSSKWKSPQYTTYDSSLIQSFHFCPVIQYHTAYNEFGLWNRFKMYANLSPVVSYSRVVLPIALRETTSFLYINEMSYGARFTVGAEYALSNQVGVFLNTSLQQSFVKSQLYIDSNYLLQNVNIGLCFTLLKSKTFNL